MRPWVPLLPLLVLVAGCSGPAPASGDAAGPDGPAAPAWSPPVQDNGDFLLTQPYPCARTPVGHAPSCITFLSVFSVPPGQQGLRLNLTAKSGSFTQLLADGPGDCDLGPLSTDQRDPPLTAVLDCPGLGPGDHTFEVDIAQGDVKGSLTAATLRRL